MRGERWNEEAQVHTHTLTHTRTHTLSRTLILPRGTFGKRRVERRGAMRGERGKVLLGKAIWKREFKLPWREAGPPNHHDDKVDSDQ